MSLTLYATPYGRSAKILIAAHYAGVDIKLVEYDPRVASAEQKAELLKKNPNALIPVLETPEGFIYESNAILRYIARYNDNSKLYGSSTYEKAVVDQFLDWNSLTLEPVVFGYLLPYLGRVKYDKTAQDQALETVKKTLRILDDKLKQSKYLAGDNITIADLQTLVPVGLLYRFVFDEKARKPFQNLTKYYEQISNEENVKKVLGRPVLCKTPLQPYTGQL